MSENAAAAAANPAFFWRLVEFARPLRRHRWLPDAFGVAMFAAALALRFAVDAVLPPGFPFLTFFPVVILTTFFCGLRPGITCATLSTIASWYFFIGPATGMEMTGQAMMALAFFISIASIDIILIHFTFSAADKLRAEKETTARLYESQRTMFQELQHRVANNMQFVAALLLLQKRRVADDPGQAVAALDEARARLDTIARIHRQLHAPERLDLPTGQYLRELCCDLVAASGVENIRCEVTTPDLPLSVTQLTTLSMLVAEVVTNSLKHAFADGRAGSIRILVVPRGPDRYEVSIADDGRGLPAQLDLAASQGLGWRIIQSLASQLGGTLDYGSAGGTTVRVEFAIA
ncbi:sensor histidine kinase [Ancylobacter amanitiformis]|uniref:histidine kinase n=1 Tax=Ancylobacter amanitiformis TaxID=217069 RepID=A0ABU0LQQ7_9HYPH|nr:histidine kinase dimerization/phosphoacceptor domain -containing protein [Ancylobacter amanitiformis]MDQ0511041.1 two-component sensor histidine kinase [Ancylobacter amanitiformis]